MVVGKQVGMRAKGNIKGKGLEGLFGGNKTDTIDGQDGHNRFHRSTGLVQENRSNC